MRAYVNPNFVTVTNSMAERYAEAKLTISWAEGAVAQHPGVTLGPLRKTMRLLHHAWPANSTYADATFPALLDQFDVQRDAVKPRLIA